MSACLCTPTYRCRLAWSLRNRLLRTPVDGTPASMEGRLRIARAYTAHLRASVVPTDPEMLYWPIWHEEAFPQAQRGRPRRVPV
jgi:hypothetical protein